MTVSVGYNLFEEHSFAVFKSDWYGVDLHEVNVFLWFHF